MVSSDDGSAVVKHTESLPTGISVNDRSDASLTQVEEEPPTQMCRHRPTVYTDDLGPVSIARPERLLIPEPEALTASSQIAPTPQPRSKLALRVLPESEESPHNSNKAPALYMSSVRVPPLNLNDRVSAVGRPPLDREMAESKVKQDRARFNAVTKERRVNGELSLADLLNSLDKEQIGLVSLEKCLLCVTERHRDLVNSRPEYMKQRRPDTVTDAFYTLPHPLLKKCIQMLPLTNEIEDAISIASSSQEPGNSQEYDREVEVVKIRKLFFTRGDIEAMGRASHLKEAVSMGLKLVRWLQVDVAGSLPADMQASVVKVAEQVEAMFPLRVLQGFSQDYHYAMLTRLKPPAWFNDGIIRAFMERLNQQYPGFRGTSVQRASMSPRLTTGLSARVNDEIVQIVSDARIQTFAVPVCFGDRDGMHWTCIITEKTAFRATVYDSMNSSTTQNIMRIFVKCIFRPFGKTNADVQVHDTPAQFHSCGFFVCLKMWMTIDPSFRNEYQELGDYALRFKLLRYIPYGSNV